MNAVSYAVENLPHPYNDKLRAAGVMAWCLVKITRPEMGHGTTEPVAIFNLDSEAETFQGHVLAEGLDGKLVSIDPQIKELLGLLRGRRGGAR